MREKLIELFEGSLRYAGDVCGETGNCSKCQYDKYGANCGYAARADYFIANGVTIAKWIPVTERLPEKDVLVLCIGSKGGMFLGYPRWVYEDEKVAYTYVPNSRHGRQAKYWMPLPEPPKGEK